MNLENWFDLVLSYLMMKLFSKVIDSRQFKWLPAILQLSYSWWGGGGNVEYYMNEYFLWNSHERFLGTNIFR